MSFHWEPRLCSISHLRYTYLSGNNRWRPLNNGGRGFRGDNLLLRTSVAANQVTQAVRAEVQRIDPDVILEDFTALKPNFAFDRDRMDLDANPRPAPPRRRLPIQRQHHSGRHANAVKAAGVEYMSHVELRPDPDGAPRLEIESGTALEREVVDGTNTAVI
jgi:hypothetical protein